MNSPVLIGLLSLLIHHISAQLDCTSLSCPQGSSCSTYKDICDLTSGCEWDNDDSDCEGEGESERSCCSTALITTTKNPTPSPTCPDTSTSCYALDQNCCATNNGCDYRQTSLCLSEGGPGCCADITPLPTTTTQSPTPQPTTAPSCPDYSSNSNQCNLYDESCCPIQNGICYWKQTPLCLTEGGPSCCEEITPSPTTNEPTSSPTCPDYSSNANPCKYYTFDCCPTNNGICYWDTSSLCRNEGGPYCCKPITPPPTEQPTEFPTSNPSPNPTTTTTVQTTTAEPTTTTTTAGPTTTTTTAEPTTTTTTAEPTTTSTTTTTTTTTAEPSTTTSSTSTTKQSPTPRPTMKSAIKWEMIHPAYGGGDGELLWHVYYGDFSDDQRFDEFRTKQMWDCNELRSIIQSDGKFERYQMEEKNEKSEAVLADSGVTTNKILKPHSSYGTWIIFGAMLFICCFALWYRYQSDSSKMFNKFESKPLLKEPNISYDGYQEIY